MRIPLLAAFLLLVTGVSGCLAPEDLGDLGDHVGDPAPDADALRSEFLKDHPEFCDAEDACDYWDDFYHEYVVYDLDTFEFDVIVVPPVTGDPLVHIQAARQAVEAWRDGILYFAQPWLAERFRLDVYVVGEDIIPPEALSDPEIIVLSGGVTTTLVGIGLEPKQIACLLVGEGARSISPVSYNQGWERRSADCTGVGFTCFAINVAGAPGEERDLYDLIAHEVGHCLGAGHVGDALDFRARYAPVVDIMSYQSRPEQVNCVSNMNVRVLEGVYAHLLDRPEEDWLPRGSYLEFDPLHYETVECANPPSA